MFWKQYIIFCNFLFFITTLILFTDKNSFIIDRFPNKKVKLDSL